MCIGSNWHFLDHMKSGGFAPSSKCCLCYCTVVTFQPCGWVPMGPIGFLPTHFFSVYSIGFFSIVDPRDISNLWICSNQFGSWIFFQAFLIFLAFLHSVNLSSKPYTMQCLALIYYYVLMSQSLRTYLILTNCDLSTQ